ncbi:MAG: FadD3 family acyl-CoA ligase [Pseudomonadota bacterium]
MVTRAAQQFGTAPAIISEAGTCSFETLALRVREVAQALISTGVRRGDRVGIWAPNSPQWIFTALGAASVGAVIVPINTRLKGGEAAYILARSGTTQLFTVDDFLGVDYPQLLASQSLPALQRITLFPGSAAATESWRNFLEGGESASAQQLHAAMSAVAADDIADIMFTSGTTGEPKGVMSSQEQNLRTSSTWSEWVGLQTGDRYLIANPFFHSFGYKAGWLACLLRGATIYPMPVFNAATALELIAREKITVLPGPPTIFQSLLSDARRASTDLSSLRLAVTGAASVAPALITRMRTELGFRSVLTAYGLTESCGVLTICPAGTSDERVAQTCGVPITGVELRCVNEEGTSVAPGESGEVIARGYNVMRGYFADPAATAAAVDAEGWLHTGDIGSLDAEGFLRITDRKKDMFIVGGFNCYPAEIEKIMSSHPAIAQVAVIGVNDERLGEVGHAFVVLRPDASAEATAIIDWCRAQMANYKAPRSVRIVASLPTNAAGKVQKFTLRDGYTG